MATISITLAGITSSYTIGSAEIQRVLNVFDPADNQTNAQTAAQIADGFIQGLIDQVRAVEVDAVKTAAGNAVIPIAITKNP